jgi:DnaJ-domain-containing protein 1
LKKLYREAARLIHPDLTTDEKERVRRHHIMADVNQAYQDGDEERLQQILHQWECSPESVEGEGVGAELIRVIRKITRATERLEEVKKHIETIKNSDLFMLKTKVLLAKEYGRDLLVEMAAEVDKQIIEAKKRYRNLLGTGGKKHAGRKR